ncbi:MAG: hypothetical protein ACLS29_10935 [Prevotellamassilia sp.]
MKNSANVGLYLESSKHGRM